MTKAIERPQPPTDAASPVGAPLGPGSLTWKYFADWRVGLLGPRAGVLENMLPALGQGVMDHSVFFDNPFARVQRSLPPIYRTVYAPEGDHTGHTVRDFHTDIKGEMPDGSRYHALNPETYYWAHATFLDIVLTGTERFIRPLSDAEKEQLYAESITWYRRYGVSEQPMPATYADFVAYWDRMIADVLVPHRTAAYGLGYVTKGVHRIPPPPGLPKPLWQAVTRAIGPFVVFLTVGGMPEQSRAQLELPWTAAQERRYRRFCAAMRTASPVFDRLPGRLRVNKYALAGYRRAGTKA